jgi:general secretion pathway protein L
MRETVFIRSSKVQTGGQVAAFEWLRADTEGPVGAPVRGRLEEAALECEGRRVIYLVPAEDILLTAAIVPARNRQRILQALPFMLEDRLVQEIEQLHFAIGERAPDGNVAVAIAERVRLDTWLGELRSAGIEPDMLVPDVLALPCEPGAWTVLREGGICLVRTSTQAGFAVDSDNLAMMLEQALEEASANRPSRVIVHRDEASPSDEALAAMDVEMAFEPLTGRGIELMARHFHEREAIDLLQGSYSRREQLSRLYRPWLPVAVTLGIVLMLNIIETGYDYVHLSRENQRLQASIEGIYRSAFPDARRVVDPRVQMERGLESLRRGGTDEGGFLTMLNTAAPLLKQADAVVQRLAYQKDRLDLALTIGDLQKLDGLKQQLSQHTGLEVEIQSATASNGRVEARLQLRAKS